MFNVYLRRHEDSTPIFASNSPEVLIAVLDALQRVLEQVRHEVSQQDAEARWLRIIRQVEGDGDDSTE
jgi:predicted ArsR family transcriptional regulator